MFLFRLAYRHQNNEVEGFKGVGFTKQTAQADAERNARNKCEAIRQPYDPNRLINNPEGLSPEDLKIIRKDWQQ